MRFSGRKQIALIVVSILLIILVPYGYDELNPCAASASAAAPNAKVSNSRVVSLENSPRVGEMASGQADAGSDVVGGELFVVGGYGHTDSDPLDSVSIYSPSNGTWRLGPDYPVRAWGLACAGIGDSLYCFGGQGAGLRAYKLKSSSLGSGWTPIRDLPTDHNDSQGLVAVADPSGGRIFILGSSNSQATRSTLVYTVASDSYARKADMPFGNRWFTAVIYEGKLFIFGGISGNQDAVYDISTSRWTASGCMPGPPRFGMIRNPGTIAGLVPIVDGKARGQNFHDSTYFYNLTDNQFVPGPPTFLARDGVAGGIVGTTLYIAGGRNDSGNPVGLTETEGLDLSQLANV